MFCLENITLHFREKTLLDQHYLRFRIMNFLTLDGRNSAFLNLVWVLCTVFLSFFSTYLSLICSYMSSKRILYRFPDFSLLCRYLPFGPLPCGPQMALLSLDSQFYIFNVVRVHNSACVCCLCPGRIIIGLRSYVLFSWWNDDCWPEIYCFIYSVWLF